MTTLEYNLECKLIREKNGPAIKDRYTRKKQLPIYQKVSAASG
tara:strand:- start:13 stop:141 length:129 start_codon:yes stop_codon:yes gene_type:complete